MDSTSAYVLFDQSAQLVTFEGTDIQLMDSDELRFGDASGGDVVAKWDGTQFSVTTALGTLAAEKHGLSLVVTGTLASGKSMVGLNSQVTTAGTGGAWVSGIYAKVTQGATKNVNGYISGAEFEVINTAANVSDWFVLVLNSNSSYMGSHTAFIALREYGSADIGRLLWAPEMAQGSNSDTAIFSSVASDSPCDRKMRVTIGTTDYWLMLTTEGPSTS
jgi:hypothetical protein